MAIGIVAIIVGTFFFCVIGLRVFSKLANKFFAWVFWDGVKEGLYGRPNQSDDKKVTAAELIERGDAYVKKGRLLTEPEQMLFKVLQYKYGETHHVFCQVRVVDVIQPNTALYKERSREWMALFRQVSQWHFDFVICDKETMEVVRVIELDDASHERKDRARRDGILNKICEDVSVGIQRVDLGAFLKAA